MAQEASAPATTTAPATAATPVADNASPSQPAQVDLADAELKDLDTLFTTGKLDIPAPEGSDGGGKVGSEPAPAAPEPAPVTPETPAAPAAPETPATPAVETPATPEVPAAPATPETPATPIPPAELPETPTERPRLKDPDDQQIASIYRHAKDSGTPISWAEAERRVKGEPAASVTATDQPVVTIDSLRTDVADLERQLEEKAGEEGVLYDKSIKDLQTQLSDKKLDLKLAERDQQAQDNSTRESRKAARQQAHARAITTFPTLADRDSPLGKAVAARIAELKATDSPVLYDDNAPWLIALDEAAKLGIAPVADKPAPAAPTPSTATSPTPPAPARKVVSPPSAALSSAPATPVNPQAEKAKTVEYLKKDAPLEELDALFNPGGKDSLLFAVAGR